MTAVLDGDFVESAVPDLSRVSLAELTSLDLTQDHAVIRQAIGHPERDRQEQMSYQRELARQREEQEN